jgi:hypothetical protein
MGWQVQISVPCQLDKYPQVTIIGTGYTRDSHVNTTSAAARGVTRSLVGVALCVLVAYSGQMRADEKSKRFDGEWDTILSCPNLAGALGYSFAFPALIKEGILHGEKGVKGEPGWLQLDGAIAADGRANLYANGLVGASEAAVGHRPAGTQYGYHVEVEFTDTSGKGQRVEGRPCSVTFTRKR